MRKVFLILVGIIMMSAVSALQITTFNNSLSSEFISFTNAGSTLRYLSIPQNTYLTNGSINITYPSGGNLFVGLKLYYDFNGTRERVSGIYNLTSNEGTVSYNNSNCKLDGCGQYRTGNNNKIMNNTNINGVSNFTWNLWFRRANYTSDAERIISRGNNFGTISTENSTSWYFQDRFTGAAYTPITPSLVNGSWYMITITSYSNGTNNNVTIYVNGTIKTSGYTGTLNQSGLENMFLGTGFDGNYDLNGQMDEFGVWNRTLTLSEVSQLYNGGSALGYDALGSGNLELKIGTTDVQDIMVSNSTTASNASSLVTGLHTTINNYLSSCTYSGGYCNVPFNFSSAVEGTFVLYNKLNFSNTGFLENSQIYNSPVQELSSQSLMANISYDSNYYTITGTLIYNNTRYAGTKIGSGDEVVFNRTVIAPSVSGNTNIPFYWEFLLNNGTSQTYYNSTFKNQTVTDLSIDDCTSNTIMILNYTIYDEDSRIKITSSLNTSFEVNIKIGDSDMNDYVALSFNKSNVNPLAVCVASLNSTLRLDATAKYNSDNRVTEYHNIQNYSLSNTTIPINVSLYDLLSTRSTEYLITYKDAYFIPVSDAIIEITREYLPIGQFLTVEIPLTDMDGKTIGHFVSNDETYTIYVKKYGRLLATYENIKVFCASAVNDCRLNLNEQGSSSSIESFLNKDGISYRTGYNDTTRVYSFEFIVNDGTDKYFSLNITKFDIDQNISICNTGLTSSSGTLSCTIPTAYGNGSAIAKVYKTNSLFLSDIFSIKISNRDVLENSRYIFAAILIISLPLMAIASPILAVVFFVIGLVVAGLMVAVDWGGYVGATTAILWFIIAAIILIIVRNRRDNND